MHIASPINVHQNSQRPAWISGEENEAPSLNEKLVKERAAIFNHPWQSRTRATRWPFWRLNGTV